MTGSAVLPRARNHRTFLALLAIVSLLLSLVSPVSAQLARPEPKAAAPLADHTASDFFIFSKAVFGKAVDAEGGIQCDGSQDLTASVSGSDNEIFGRIHSNADWNGGGQNNDFYSDVTFGTHDTDCTSDPGDNDYNPPAPPNDGSPTEIVGSPAGVDPATGWPGTLGNHLNADQLTFGGVDPSATGADIQQVLGVGAMCDVGSLDETEPYDIDPVNDNNKVICSGSGKLSLNISGTQASPLTMMVTIVSHGLVEISGQWASLSPHVHGVLIWTDQSSFDQEFSAKVAGSNFNIGPAIIFTPRSGQDISGSVGDELCIQHIGQGQIKVQGSTSDFGPGACGPPPPVIDIEKEPDEGDPGNDVTAGDTATFTLRTTNTGGSTATGVKLNDTLPVAQNGWTIAASTWPASPDPAACVISGAPATAQTLTCGGASGVSLGAGLFLDVSVSTVVDGVGAANDCGGFNNPDATATTTNDGSDTDAGEIDVLCAVIDIEKEPDEGDPGNDVTAGDTATFALRTSNTGSGTATGVKLTDTLPVAQNGWTIAASTWPASPDPAACVITGAPATAQTLTCGGASGVSLGAGLFLDVSVSTVADGVGAANDCGGFNNPDAMATTTNDGSDTDAGEIDVLCASIDIEKEPDEGDPGNDVNAGDTATFTLRTTNNGAGTATGVKLTDTLPVAQNGWTITTNWSADEALDCDITDPATQPQILTCGGLTGISLAPSAFIDVVVSTTADGTGEQNDCNGFNNPDAVVTSGNNGTDTDAGEIDVLCPDIEVDKTPDEGDLEAEVTAGEFGVFTITTSNDGQGTATGVTLFDDLLDLTNAWEIVDGDTTWDVCTISTDPVNVDADPELEDIGQWLNCGPEPLAAGAELVVVVRVLTDPADCDVETDVLVVPNTADADSANDGSDSDDGQLTILCPDIEVDKTPDEGDLEAEVTAGDFGTFTITTSNTGQGDATGVTLFDDLLDLTNLWEIVDADTTWTTCAITNPPADDPDLGQVLNCGPEPLAAGAELVVVVRVLTDPADCDVETDVLVVPNTADADSANDGSDSDDGQLTILCPDIEVDKTPDEGDLEAEVTAGDFGTFTITTSNTGQGDATGVTLFDDLLDLTNLWEIVDADTTWTTCAITNPPADDPDLGQVLNCGPEPLAAGAELVVVVRVLTDPADCDVETDVLVVPNTADADSANDGSDSDDGQLTILCPDIEVDKTPDEGDLEAEVTAGDFGTFTITTSNTGQGDATGVTLFDDLLDLTNLWEIVDADTTWTTCAITNPPADDPDLGQVLNCGPEPLAAGAELVVVVRVLTDPADCDVETDVLVVPNTADADSANDGSDSDDGQLTILCPDIEVDKTPDEGDLEAEVTAGDFGTFTITTSNTGQGDATGVTLFDDLLDLTNLWEIVDADTTWTTCAITNPPADDPDLGQVLNCGPEPLAAGAELVVVVRVLTDPADCDVETDVLVVPNTADADSANDGSDSDDGQLTILCPDIEVDKTPDEGDLEAEVTAGDFGTFTITTSNTGQGDATGVTLFDDLLDLTNLWEIVDADTTWTTCAITNPPADDPDLGQVLNCGPEPLAAGAELVVVVRVLTDPADCDVETDVLVVPNTADADSANDGSDSDDGQLTILCPDIEVDKTPDEGDLEAEVTAGDFGTFTITTSNTGQGDATGVTLFDDLLDLTNLWEIVDADTTWTTCAITNPPADDPDLGQVLNCGPEPLAAGAELVVVVRVLTDPADCDVETDVLVVPNTADADSANDGSDSDDGQLTILCPDIEVDKTATEPVITSTQEASFTIVVSGGPIGSTGDVELDDLLPADFTWTVGGADITDCSDDSFVTNLADGDELAGGTLLECNFGPLGVDETRTITLTATTTETDCDLTIENTAEVTTPGEANLENNSSTATIEVQCPDLDRSKTADAPIVSAGQQIGFVIEVSNSDAEGTGIAFNVTIDDPLPIGDGIAWEIADDSLDGGACSITGLAPAAQTLVCDFDDLAPGEGGSVHVVSDTTLDSCATYLNVATVDADNHAALTAEALVTVECPGFNHAKVADPATIVAGATATFHIVLWNTGDGTAFNATLEDDLPGDLNWSEDSADCEIAAGILTCDFGDLAPGSTMAEPGASVTLTALTDRTDCGVLNNTSIADTDPGDPIPASASITVRCPEVEITKVNNTVAPVLPGTVVGFTVTVVVTDGPADDVTVVDTLPAGYDAPTDISNGGTYNATTRKITWSPIDLATGTYTRTYTARVSAGVANGTSLVNVAVVFSPNSQCPDLESLEPECDDDSTVLVRVPTLVIDKVANAEVITISGPTTAQTASPSLVIWTLSYTLTNGPVTNAIITDVVPTGLTFVSASNGGTYNAATRTITWILASPLTASGSVTFQTTIDVATISRTAPTVNVTTIDSNETAPDTGQDEIRVVVEPPPLASTATPRPLPDTAIGFGLDGEPVTIPLEFLVVLFLGSLGALAFANVRAARRRRR